MRWWGKVYLNTGVIRHGGANMAECQNCDLEKRTANLERIAENQEVRIKDLEEDVRKNSEQRKESYNRFEKLTLENQKHEMKIENIFEKLNSMDVKMDDIDHKIDEISSRPAKTVGQFTSAIIGAIGSAFGTGIIFLIIYAFSQSMK